MIIKEGITLLQHFLDASQDEQRRRFEATINEPVKHRKLSPRHQSVRRRWHYTAPNQRIIEATHTPEAAWNIVAADDKRRAGPIRSATCSTTSPTKKSRWTCRGSPRRSLGPRALPRV